MYGGLAGLDEGEAVVALIDVQEARLERMRVIVSEPEAKDLAVERHHAIDLLDALDVENDMPKPQGSGAKAGNRPTRHERLGGNLGSVKDLQPIAERVAEDDKILHHPLVGECLRAARDLHIRCIELRRQRVKRSSVGHLPAEYIDALAAVGVNDDALLAVVHAKRNRR
jgi:hypothetical protein